MKLSLLKRLIEDNKLPDSVLFFVVQGLNPENKKFLVEQYVRQIAKNRKLSIQYLDEYKPEEAEYDLFETEDTKANAPYRYVQVESFKVSSSNILNEDRLIILTKEITFEKGLPEDLVEFINKQTVTIPNIEDWQIIDYIMSRAGGLSVETAKWLYNLYNGDAYRIDNELNKISLFSDREQKIVMEEFKRSDIFDDIPKDTIFSISNAIASKDASKLGALYHYKDDLIKPRDGEMGFIALLYKTFKNLILVKTAQNPTPETTGLTEKQIYAIQKIPRAYTGKQLLKIFELLSDIDRQIKNGELDMNYVVDYLIIKIFTI